jgi:hypothetical protein
MVYQGLLHLVNVALKQSDTPSIREIAAFSRAIHGYDSNL